ncbi:single-stranded DNA-binding protein [Aeromicrobium tamlense]|uniref:Single-stranded DNA-binding protein n=1 Tax=Aeromicrobium tamlense TaxID=375541 RepID=A0A8I0FXJ4_9ACTN|nr:single-stranded DNA-binding protein [Aeromicrobium tamlense]MBD1270805.1 single-stranded DNA-binding protein [Aeromicrobium tamlense]NYI38197.1 single-stranded DNA-binding protein [Aeromicrobium tamlense]
MTIPTQMSMHGFIATAPELSFTSTGAARFHARVGVEQFRKETDGTFTRLDPAFADLVMFNKTAERAYSRFRVGDQFVASGYVHQYDRDTNQRTLEQFVARRIGHDCARTRYSVDRSPTHQPDPPADPMTVTDTSTAVGL